MKNLKQLDRDAFGRKRELGGAALEYAIVSVFGLILSVGAIGFLTTAMEDKFSQMEEAVGIEFDINSLNPFRTE